MNKRIIMSFCKVTCTSKLRWNAKRRKECRETTRCQKVREMMKELK